MYEDPRFGRTSEQKCQQDASNLVVIAVVIVILIALVIGVVMITYRGP